MSNLTKYEVLKHRHLSLLKKLEEHGIEVHYSQLNGEWQIALPEALINTIAQLLELTAKAVGSPPQTIMGIPFVEVDAIDKLRAFLVHNVQPDGPIIFGIDLGEDADPQQHAMADALTSLRENPRPLHSGKCPVDFSKGAENFGGKPAPSYHWECGVREDNGMLRMREANGDVHERTIDATLNALIVGLRHAMVSAASAKA